MQTRTKEWVFDKNVHWLMFIHVSPSTMMCWPHFTQGLIWKGNSSFVKERIDYCLSYSSLYAWSK